jgi:hypothetical protein
MKRKPTMKNLLLVTVATVAVTNGANAVEMPDQLIGNWCDIPKRSSYDNGVLPERSNGWHVHHLNGNGEFTVDECMSRDGFPFEITKDHFAGCTPLHISKMNVVGSLGRTLEWTIKARCGGDGDDTFRATVKFSLWKGYTLTTYWK